MAGRIPQAFIDELIARADIVEVIASRIQLKKAGREYKACCPFHGEKTASFTVSPDKQFYHCFGCGMHGTAIGFLMEHDKLEFVEAVEELASRLGLEVPREAGANLRQPQAAGDDLYQVNAHAAQFYRDCLKEDSRAIEYLKKRGLTGETAAQFAIGYAPDSWNAVLKKFGATDAARRSLCAAGLIVERDAQQAASTAGFYDRFRDRIMFPIRDARGRVIAFGGRILDKGDPKYLNSPETTLFHKGKELYGLYEARQSRQPLHRLLIVEGYMDVVRLHQAGITYALATLGTATTAQHLERVFRLTAEVVFGFDGDRAGRTAAWRALENALPVAKAGRSIRFLFLPEGHDPDSLVGEEGREAFEARIAKAIPLHKFLVQELLAQIGPSAGNKAKLLATAHPLIARMPADAYREETIRELANGAGMSHVSEVLRWIEQPLNSGSRPATSRSASSASPAVSAGRGSLVRQSISLLLNYPEAARLVGSFERLEDIEQPGVPLLTDLIADLREQPAAHKAAVLERWRHRPEGQTLMKLALADNALPDAQAAAKDLQVAIDTILGEWQFARRADELIEKDRLSGLSKEELLELNELLKARNRSAAQVPKT